MEFKSFAAFRKNPADGTAVRMFVPAEAKIVDPERRTVDFVISTEDVDRYGDSIKVNGWRWNDFLRNPVVLWCHDYKNLPIGRALSVGVQDGKLVARVEFIGPDLSPFAERVFQMVRAGYLNATSVGFMIIKWTWVEDKEAGRYGLDILESELLEISVVTVPANQEALVQGRDKKPETGAEPEAKAAEAKGAAGEAAEEPGPEAEAGEKAAGETEAPEEENGPSPAAGMKRRAAELAIIRLRGAA